MLERIEGDKFIGAIKFLKVKESMFAEEEDFWKALHGGEECAFLNPYSLENKYEHAKICPYLRAMDANH